MVAPLGLGRGREYRVRQPVGHAQPGRQGDAAHLAGALVVFPARSDQVATDDGLDRQRLQSPHDHAAVGDGRALRRVGHYALERVGREMVRHDVAGAREPEVRNAGEHAAFSRDRVRQYHVEGAQPVGGDDQHVSVVDGIDVANLALVRTREAAQVRLVHRWRGGGGVRHGGNSGVGMRAVRC